MSDAAQVKAIGEEIANSASNSIALSDRRHHLSRLMMNVDPALLGAIESMMGINRETKP